MQIKQYHHYIILEDGTTYNTITQRYVTFTPNKATRYLQCCLTIDKKQYTIYQHRLLADLFLAKPSDQHNVVNHKDGNKQNNALTNLEWVTYEENHHHYVTVLRPNNAHNKTTPLQQVYNNRMFRKRRRALTMYNKFGVHISEIPKKHICNFSPYIEDGFIQYNKLILEKNTELIAICNEIITTKIYAETK